MLVYLSMLDDSLQQLGPGMVRLATGFCDATT